MSTNKKQPPPRWKAIFVKWLGIFPSVLLIAYAINWIGIKPMFWKLLVETIILVPLLTYIVTPLLKTLFSDWLYAGMDVPKEERETVEIGN